MAFDKKYILKEKDCIESFLKHSLSNNTAAGVDFTYEFNVRQIDPAWTAHLSSLGNEVRRHVGLPFNLRMFRADSSRQLKLQKHNGTKGIGRFHQVEMIFDNWDDVNSENFGDFWPYKAKARCRKCRKTVCFGYLNKFLNDYCS